MGKKKTRKTYKSAGMHSNVAKSTLRLAREGVSSMEKELNKVKAWREGKNPWITVENNQRGTNKPFYKVRANELYGNPKTATYSIFRGKE
jgi:hypothetical protein